MRVFGGSMYFMVMLFTLICIQTLPINPTSALQLDSEVPYLEITSDDQFAVFANQYGWDGDGSEVNPFIIQNLSFNNGVSSPLGESIRDKVYNHEQAGYLYLGGYEKFDMVLTNVSYHIIFQNNEFMYTLMINNTDNVQLINNRWVNDHYPSNLWIGGDSAALMDNQFSGSNDLCDVGTDLFTPRVFLFGSGYTVSHNLFGVDRGCHPIQQLVLWPHYSEIPESPNNNWLLTSITHNSFKASDYAIQALLQNIIVSNNDFEFGDFAITIENQVVFAHTEVTQNNFYVSHRGTVGMQTYDGAYRHVIFPVFYSKQENESRRSFWGDQTPLIRYNYYSDWEGDTNHDGIVDVARPFSPTADNSRVGAVYDFAPSVYEFQGYYPVSDSFFGHYFLWFVFTLASIGGIVGWYREDKYRKYTQIFDGDLSGPPNQYVKELFRSHTVLYYTLIGQNRNSEKGINDKIKESIPHDLFEFKHIFHPIRLSLMKILFESLEMTSVEIRDILDIKWNEYYSHINALKKFKLIKVEEKFKDGYLRQVVSLEPKGIEEFKTLTDLLNLFLDSATNYNAYIEAAQARLTDTDQDTYPKP